MAEPFPDLVPAIGTIFFRIMSEQLTADTTTDRSDKLEAVRLAILEAWPEEVEMSRTRVTWEDTPGGGVRALYDKPMST